MVQPGEQLFSRRCIFYRSGTNRTVFRRLQNLTRSGLHYSGIVCTAVNQINETG